jgi:hypothetical protein
VPDAKSDECLHQARRLGVRTLSRSLFAARFTASEPAPATFEATVPY